MLNFYPRAGQVLMGDFSDLRVPEITKVRPVIVISPRLPNRSELVAIVPISLTPPHRPLPYVHKLTKNYNPLSPESLECWAKCDLVMNVALRRLSGFKVDRRKWVFPSLTPEDLSAVRRAVLAGLGLDRLES